MKPSWKKGGKRHEQASDIEASRKQGEQDSERRTLRQDCEVSCRKCIVSDEDRQEEVGQEKTGRDGS